MHRNRQLDRIGAAGAGEMITHVPQHESDLLDVGEMIDHLHCAWRLRARAPHRECADAGGEASLEDIAAIHRANGSASATISRWRRPPPPRIPPPASGRA